MWVLREEEDSTVSEIYYSHSKELWGTEASLLLQDLLEERRPGGVYDPENFTELQRRHKGWPNWDHIDLIVVLPGAEGLVGKGCHTDMVAAVAQSIAVRVATVDVALKHVVFHRFLRCPIVNQRSWKTGYAKIVCGDYIETWEQTEPGVWVKPR